MVYGDDSMKPVGRPTDVIVFQDLRRNRLPPPWLTQHPLAKAKGKTEAKAAA